MKTPNICRGLCAAWSSWARAVPLVLGVCSVLAVGLTAGFASSAAAHPGEAAAIAGSATFTDPTGDATGPAPDITTVVVSDDAATGTVTVTLTAVGFSTVGADSYPMVKVYMNTDKNEATGAPDQLGAEYFLAVARDPAGAYWWISSWDGSKYTQVTSSPTMSERRTGDTITWTINKSDIGGSAAFGFFAWSSTWDANDNKTGEDSAPDGGGWTYDVAAGTSPTTTTPQAPTKVTLLIESPKTIPARAVAGKRFTVTFPVHFQKEEHGTSIQISTGQTRPVTVISWSPVPTGKMVCDPSVTGKVIAHSESFKNSQARLSFVIPNTAKAKLLRVSVKITATEKETGKTVSATRIATFRVR